MSTCVHWKYRQPDAHAHHHQLISALAIRIVSALIARATLRIDLIAVPSPRSPKSVKKRCQGVICISNIDYVDMCSLKISPTGRGCISPSIHFCSGNKIFSALIARAALRISAQAIRIYSALIAVAALRINLITVSPPRSPESVNKRYQGVICIWNNYCVNMCSLKISSTSITRMHITVNRLLLWQSFTWERQ